MNIVERIKWKLKQKNVSIKAYERELGIGNGTIAKWEKQMPRIDKLILVADNLQVSLDWLVFGKENSELNEEERQLLKAYHQADAGTQKSVRKLLDIPEAGTETSSGSQTGKAV